jgi:hypothetical protein
MFNNFIKEHEENNLHRFSYKLMLSLLEKRKLYLDECGYKICNGITNKKLISYYCNSLRQLTITVELPIPKMHCNRLSLLFCAEVFTTNTERCDTCEKRAKQIRNNGDYR